MAASAFSLKAEIPATFSRGEKIEIATADSAFHVLLGIQDGGLTLQDQATVVGRFDPAKSFGNSAFGPLRFRPVDERGVAGDWKPLAKLVRVPALKELMLPGRSESALHFEGRKPVLARGGRGRSPVLSSGHRAGGIH